MTRQFTAIMLAAALATGAAPVAGAQTAPLYHLVHSIPLGAPEHWDYLNYDAPSKDLFISHGSEVTVVNMHSNKIVGHITGLMGSHGIAIDHDNGLGYVDSAKDQSTTIFNLKTLKIVAKISALEDADGMAYDPVSKQVFIVGGDANAAIAIDAATNKLAKTIPLGGAPEFLAVDGAGSLYVAINDKDEIVRIDTKTNTVTATWPTAPCASPTGMAIDPATRRLFASCRSGLMLVMDADNGKIVTTLPIDKGTDAAGFDAENHRVFSSDWLGTLNVIDEKSADEFTTLGTVTTMPGARTMAVNPANGDVYVVTAKVASMTPPTKPGGYAHPNYVPGSLELLVYAQTK